MNTETDNTAPLTIDDFCRRHQISRSTYYNMRAAGLAPREFIIGKLVRISAEAEAAWVRKLEVDSDARRDNRTAA